MTEGNGIRFDDDTIPPNVPEQCRGCWVMLMRLNQQVARIQADERAVQEKVGKLHVPVTVWLFLAAQLVMAIGSAMSLSAQQARLATKVDGVAIQVAELRGEVSSHVGSPGHPQMVERVDALRQRMDRGMATR